MIEWKEKPKESAFERWGGYPKVFMAWCADIGPYSVVIRDGVLTCSASVYTLNNYNDPVVVLHLIDVEAAKKAAIDWIRNDLWNTLNQVGIGTITSGSTTAWGSGGSIPATSGTIYLKPNQLGGITWTYAQHNS